MTNESSAGQEKALTTERATGVMDHKVERLSWGMVRSLPKRLSKWLNNALGKIVAYTTGSQDGVVKLDELTQVPTFWAGNPGGITVLISDSLALIIGIAFGAIHCIAWSSQFPSRRIRILWRLSAAAIAGVPLFISTSVSVVAFLWFIFNAERLTRWWKDTTDHWKSRISRWRRRMDYWKGFWIPIKYLLVMITIFLILIGGVLILVGGIILIVLLLVLVTGFILSCLLYVVARASTLVIALMTLKSLPPGAYQTVQWTTFIPHI